MRGLECISGIMAGAVSQNLPLFWNAYACKMGGATQKSTGD